MPAADIPAFLRKLGTSNNHPVVREALRFLILTALRTGEVLELRWTDFSVDMRKLTIPGERMKSGKPHSVVLSKQARSLLEDMKRISGGREHVFPGFRNPKRAMSQMTLLACLKDIEPGFTVHGFRSSFSTWAHSKSFPPHVVERCLAHASADKIAAAYNRHGYDTEAAKLWQAWADVLDRRKA